jgi:RimJ/RimL family protein N-acetyltransferase
MLGPMALPMQINRFDNGQIEIMTARLLLRAAMDNDVEGLHEAMSDPEAMRYW